MNGVCNGKYLFGHTPWGPVEGSKGKISFNFDYKVNFKDFLNQTLCVFSQMKDIKHIRWDFQSVTWGCPGGQKNFFQTWSCGISNRQG